MSSKTTTSGSGCRHNRPPGLLQMDLFKSEPPDVTGDTPAWPELPVEARAALTNLMTLLILDHVARTVTPPVTEAGHDL